MFSNLVRCKRCSYNLPIILLAVEIFVLQVCWLQSVDAQTKQGVCSVTVNYGAALGDRSTSNSDLPVFVGSLTLVNNMLQENVSSWILGWSFSRGEVIQSVNDVFGDASLNGVILGSRPSYFITGNGTNVSVTHQEVILNSSTPLLNGGQGEVTLSFVALKGPRGMDPNNPGDPRVEALDHVFLNNQHCSPLMPRQGGGATVSSASSDGAGTPALPELRAVPLLADPPHLLRVDYMPIVYQGPEGTALFLTSFTQMYLKVSNPGLDHAVALGDVSLQYWFDGPVSLDGVTGSDPWDYSAEELPGAQFKLYCSDMSPELGANCSALRWNFSQGLPDVSGARYVLNLWFAPGSGYLLPPASNSSLVEALLSQAGIPALSYVEAIVSIEPRHYFAQMDQTLDYSYLATPALNSSVTVDSSSRVELRERAPNPFIPAYLTSGLAWGSPPSAGPPMQDPRTVIQSSPAPSPPSPLQGVTCSDTSIGVSCGISALYCCTGYDTLSPVPPVNWREIMLPHTVASSLGASIEPNVSASSSGGGGRPSISSWKIAAIVVPIAVVSCLILVLLVASYLARGSSVGGSPLAGTPAGGPSFYLPFRGVKGFWPLHPNLPGAAGWRRWVGKEKARHRSTTIDSCAEVSLISPSQSAWLLDARTPLLAACNVKYPTMPGSLDCAGGERCPAPMDPGCRGSRGCGGCSVEMLAHLEGMHAGGAERSAVSWPAFVRRKSGTWLGFVAAPPSTPPRSEVLARLLSAERRRTLAGPVAPLWLGCRALPPPLSPREKPIDLDIDFQTEIAPYMGRLIGIGGFGKVYEGLWRGQRVAVKVLHSHGELHYQSLVKEVELCSRFRACPNIVRLLGACLGDREHLALIMELVDGGNLSARIHATEPPLRLVEVLQICADIASGLSYLHPAVIHRDLKPQNVLLDRDGRAKIADFGISRFKDPFTSFISVTAAGGTPNYMAPELFNGTHVDEKCDVYSLGCVMYEAATRRIPFESLVSGNGGHAVNGGYNVGLFKIILAVAINGSRPEIPPDFPLRLKQLVTRCWRADPRARPSAADVHYALQVMLDDELASGATLLSAPSNQSGVQWQQSPGSGGARSGSRNGSLKPLLPAPGGSGSLESGALPKSGSGPPSWGQNGSSGLAWPDSQRSNKRQVSAEGRAKPGSAGPPLVPRLPERSQPSDVYPDIEQALWELSAGKRQNGDKAPAGSGESWATQVMRQFQLPSQDGLPALLLPTGSLPFSARHVLWDQPDTCNKSTPRSSSGSNVGSGQAGTQSHNDPA